MSGQVRDRLLERQHELNGVGGVLERAAGGAGGIGVVAGPAGIGKTRLLEVARDDAARRGFQTMTARASDLERGHAYGVVRQLLGPAVEDGRAALDPIGAHARPVFEAPARVGSGPAVASARSDAVLYGLHHLVVALSHGGPLLLSVDDAHWADAPSLLFFDYLSRRVESAPLVVLLAAREGESGTEADLVRRLEVGGSALVLSLRPLSPAATTTLVRSWLGEATSQELCEACYAATGGNPFLVRELTGALAADGAPTGRVAERVRRLVPEAVARHVLVRLSRIGQPAIRLATAVAVLGAGAELHEAAALADLAQVQAARALDALVGADVLRAGLPLEFVHPLLREAVYRDARPGQRALAHAAAARMLAEADQPAERVATQLLLCEPAGSEWATATLRAAGREAMGRGAPQAAARYLSRALSEPPPEDARRDLLLELGVAESRAGSAGATQTLHSALRLTRDPVARASIAEELAAILNLRGEFEEASSALDDAIRALPPEADELRFSLEAEAHVMAITSLKARHELADRLVTLRARRPELLQDPAAAPLLTILAIELSETDGTASDAAACARRAFAGGRLHSRPGPILAIGTGALVSAGHILEAQGILDEEISDAGSRGAIMEMHGPLATRARARNLVGSAAQAEADARASLEVSPMDPDPVRALKLAGLVDAMIARGAVSDAERLLAGGELARTDSDTILFQGLRVAHARVVELLGRPQEALEELNAVREWARAWGCVNSGWIAWRPPAALLYRALGEHEHASALAAEETAAARAFGAPHCIGVALRVAGLVEEPAEIELLRESVDLLGGAETRPELARSMIELGSALRRAGHRRDARRPLEDGRALAAECGHTLMAERARQELLASGARPRQRGAEGEALTPSEDRIARLAAEGLSNRAIAEQLFLSPKTVEMHLSHVYRKLGIASRRELDRALGADS